MMTRPSLAAAAAAALVLSTVPPAQAETFSGTTTLSPAGKMAQSAVIDGGRNGDLMAAWTVGPPAKAVLQVARRAAGGSWSTPRTISKPGATAPDLEVGKAGRACLAWEQRKAGRYRAHVTCYRPGSGWSAARALTPAGSDSGSVGVAMSPTGASVVWDRFGARDRVQTARWTAAGNRWSQAKTLSRSSVDGRDPAVGVDGTGRATATWAESVGFGPRAIVVRRQKAGGGWTAPATLTPGGQAAIAPRIAEADSGEAMVVWATTGGAGVWSSYRGGPTQGWTAAQQLSPVGVTANAPAVAANRTDDVFVVAWTADPVGGPVIQSTRRHYDGTWTPVYEPSTAGSPAVFAPAVALDAQQSATVVWQEHDGTQYRIALARQSIAFVWSPTEYIDVPSPNGCYTPEVTVFDEFQVGMIWRRYDATDKLRVQTRRYDPLT